MALVGPEIKPKLSTAQAAVKGDSRARKILLAYQHLTAAPRASDSRLGVMWDGILGPAAEACSRVCAACRRPGIDSCPAVVLADQSKAFESLSLTWLTGLCNTGKCQSGSFAPFLGWSAAAGSKAT